MATPIVANSLDSLESNAPDFPQTQQPNNRSPITAVAWTTRIAVASAASSSSDRTPNFPEARGALARVRSRAVLPRSHGLAAAAGVGSSTVDHGGRGPRTRPASAHLDTRQARHVLLLEQRRRVANLRRRFKFQTQRRDPAVSRERRLHLARLRAPSASTDTAATATRRDHRRGRSFQPPHLEQERALLKPVQSGEKRSGD